MCLQAFRCTASAVEQPNHAVLGGDVRVPARKPSQPLDRSRAPALPRGNLQSSSSYECLTLHYWTLANDPRALFRRLVNYRCQRKDLTAEDGVVFYCHLSAAVRPAEHLELLLLVSATVVYVAPASCTPRPRSLDTCTTAPSHRPAGLVFVATWCSTLALFTVATRCYASSTTAASASHPSQTLAPASTSPKVELVVAQTFPSSITHPQDNSARRYFASRRKSGRLKSTSAAGTQPAVPYNDSTVLNGHPSLVQTPLSNASAPGGNTTTRSDISAGVIRVSEQFSLDPATKQSTVRPMPPVHDEPTHTVTSDTDGGGGGGRHRFLTLVISVALLTVTLGVITTCLVHYYRDSSAVPAAGGVRPQQYVPVRVSGAHLITASMLSVVSASAAGMDAGGGGAAGRLHRHVTRELAVQRDRQVRLHSVHTDLQLDLPPSIALPDGEELPYGSSARLHIRDPEQESEIYQKCIRPPPNRTVFESESPPPYRSSSAGLLGSLGGGTGSTTSSSTVGMSGSDWSTGSTPPFVVRCHSMSSTTANKRPHETSSAAPGASATSSAPKTDFLQRTVKIFTGKKNNSQLPQPAPTLPAVVVPTAGVRTTRRLAEPPTAPARTKPQGNV